MRCNSMKYAFHVFLLANSDVSAAGATHTSKKHSKSSGENLNAPESEGPTEDRISRFWRNRIARLLPPADTYFAAVFNVIAGDRKEATETNPLAVSQCR
jgi:hypothetical protein